VRRQVKERVAPEAPDSPASDISDVREEILPVSDVAVSAAAPVCACVHSTPTTCEQAERVQAAAPVGNKPNKRNSAW
jgi:hypothetical protein